MINSISPNPFPLRTEPVRPKPKPLRASRTGKKRGEKGSFGTPSSDSISSSSSDGEVSRSEVKRPEQPSAVAILSTGLRAASFWDQFNHFVGDVGEALSNKIEKAFQPPSPTPSPQPIVPGPLYDPENQVSIDTVNKAIDQLDPGASHLGLFSENNAVYIPETTTETAMWKLELLRSARSSVEWSVNYAGGKIFREALKILQEKMEKDPHFNVHLILSDDLLEEEDHLFLQQLEASYRDQFHSLTTKIALELVPELRSQENHIKLLVVDGKYTVFGGSSFQDNLCSYEANPPKTIFDTDPLSALKSRAYGGSTDLDAVCVGQELARGQRILFYELYAFWERRVQGDKAITSRWHSLEGREKGASIALEAHPDLVQNVRMKMTLGGPSTELNACAAEYERLIRSAEKTITIANLYFNPSDNVRSALLDAVNREVLVQLVTNDNAPDSPPSNDLAVAGNFVNFVKLLTGSEKVDSWGEAERLATEKAVQVFLYQRAMIILHCKGISIDRRVAALGSFNLGLKGVLDFELLGTFENEKIAGQINARIQRDIENSRSLSIQEAMTLAHRWDYALLSEMGRLLLPLTG